MTYFQFLESYGIKPKLRSIWISVGIPIKEFGWKLHLSTVQMDVFKLLEVVLPVLVKYNVPFKIAKDPNSLGELNEGVFGETQVGKFCTIYPENDEEAKDIALELIKVTHDIRGPKIVTDQFLGGVVYSRYGAFNPKYKRDRLGLFTYSKIDNDADYKIPFKTPDNQLNPFVGLFFEPEKASTNKSLTIGPGFLIVEVIQRRAKGSIFKAIDLRSQNDIKYVVLKEGKQYCMSDNFGRDICDRLKYQKAILDKLHGVNSIPKVGVLFENHGDLFLELEYVEGFDYERKELIPFLGLNINGRIKCLLQLLQLIDIIEEIHSRGIIHRDITPRNVRIGKDDKVWLLDFELAFDVNQIDFIPFAQGTQGYMSPQQIAMKRPAYSDDIFSLGALMLMVLTGLDTRKLLFTRNDGKDFVEKILNLSGIDQNLARILNECLEEDPNSRPSLKTIKSCLNDSINSCSIYNRALYQVDDLRATIENGIKWILGPRSKDPVYNIWYSPEIQNGSFDVSHAIPPKLSILRSQSRGVSGVVYSLSRLFRLGFRKNNVIEQINFALDWLLDHYETSDDQMPGLHFGEAGVAVAIAEAVKSKTVKSGDWMEGYFSEVFSCPPDWPDITHGAAGQGMAAMLCSDLLNESKIFESVHKYADFLIKSQNLDGSWTLPKGVDSIQGFRYTGFAHGIAGILYFLLKYGERVESEVAIDSAYLSSKWLIENSKVDGKGLRYWQIQPGSNEVWHWWCHGGSGISLALMEMYKLTKDIKYKEIVEESLFLHPYNIRYGNLSQCHGLSGLGEIYLNAFKTFGDQVWMERAIEISNVLISMSRNDNFGSSWLVENPYFATSDMMIGNGGVLHFLGRLHSFSDNDIGFPLLV